MGLQTNTIQQGMPYGMDLQEVLLPELLRDLVRPLFVCVCVHLLLLVLMLLLISVYAANGPFVVRHMASRMW
jgi:hypothetical protein